PPMHAWGDHFSPVLYLFVPLGWLAPGATALLLAQTVILAAGAVVMAGFAARRLGDTRLGAGFAVLYLLSPTVHGVNVRDIHPTVFAIPLLIAAAWAVDAGRPAWAALAVVLALAGREDCAIAGVGFGVWLALARRRWLAGAGVAVACVALLWLDMNLLMPHFRGELYPHLVKRYAYLGATLPEVLASMVARPWRWIPVVFTLDKALYLVTMLAPLGFLPLAAPRAPAAARARQRQRAIRAASRHPRRGLHLPDGRGARGVGPGPRVEHRARRRQPVRGRRARSRLGAAPARRLGAPGAPGLTRAVTASPGRPERWGVWGPYRGPQLQ